METFAFCFSGKINMIIKKKISGKPIEDKWQYKCLWEGKDRNKGKIVWAHVHDVPEYTTFFLQGNW